MTQTELATQARQIRTLAKGAPAETTAAVNRLLDDALRSVLTRDAGGARYRVGLARNLATGLLSLDA